MHPDGTIGLRGTSNAKKRRVIAGRTGRGSRGWVVAIPAWLMVTALGAPACISDERDGSLYPKNTGGTGAKADGGGTSTDAGTGGSNQTGGTTGSGGTSGSTGVGKIDGSSGASGSGGAAGGASGAGGAGGAAGVGGAA